MRAAPSQVVGSHPSMGPSPAASEGPKFHAVGSTDMDFIYAFMAVTAFWMGPVLGPLVGNFFFLVAATVLAGMEMAGFIDWSRWWVALPLWSFIDGLCGQMWIANRTV